jgi:PAS domain S-box-containing protein
LSSAGVCAEVARAVDWAATSLGPLDAWPNSLKTLVAMLLHSRHPMFLWWGADLIQFYNDAYLPSFGVGKHPAAMGQRGPDCWQEIWPIIGPQIEDVMLRGKASWNEDQLVPIFRNGRVEEVYWTYGYSPVFDDDGNVGGTLVVCTETTARVVAKRRLATLGVLASRLLEAEDGTHVTQIVATVLADSALDVPFAVIDGGDVDSRAVGIDAEIVVAIRGALRASPDGVGTQTLGLDLALPGGPWPENATEAFVVSANRSSPQRFVFGLSPRLPFDDAYRAFLEQIADHALSARRRVETSREAREQRANLYRHFMQAPFPVAVLRGPEHVIELANALTLKMWGKDRDGVGLPLLSAVPELRGQPFLQLLDEVYRSGTPHEGRGELYRLPTDAGGAVEDRYVNYIYSPLYDSHRAIEGVLVCAFDVTEQVLSAQRVAKAHAEVESSLARAELGEAQFRQLVDNLPELAWHAQPDGHIDFYNRSWYEYTGTTFEQMEGWGWKIVHRPDMLEAVTKRWQRSIETGEAFEMEFPLRGADGVFRWFLTRVRPLRDKAGHIVRWVGTNTNIDERARNDEFRDVFLGILGHDLRNPLGAILTGAQLLTKRGGLPPDAEKTLARVVSSGKRMQRMIEQILDMTLARIGGGIPITRASSQSLVQVASKIVDEARTANPSRVIEVRSEGECFVAIDPDRIEQVISNLIGNAVSYGDPEKRIDVSVASNGGFVTLSVHNFGMPISPERIPRLFDPFQRGRSTVPGRDGLGLGLFIADSIVRAHGGRIEVVSSADAGTRFDVTLPCDSGTPTDSERHSL